MIAANEYAPVPCVDALNAIANMGQMSTSDIKTIMAYATGHLAERTGARETASVMANLMREAMRTTAPMTLPEIAFCVAAKHGVTVDALREPSDKIGARKDSVSVPRQEAFWLARQQKRPDGSQRYSLPQIGRYFGGRDHSTVLHGSRAHQRRLAAEGV